MKRLLTFIFFFGFVSQIGFGQTDETVVIGQHVWMVQNLHVSTFQNGDPIFQATSDEEWETAGAEGKPAWRFIDNTNRDLDTGAQENLERVYNWYAVNDARGLCPEGWHIPSSSEWDYLISQLKLYKDDSSEPSHFLDTRCYGVNFGGTFNQIGYQSGWWSTTPFDDVNAWYRVVSELDKSITSENGYKGLGFSVRCLQN